MSDVMMTTAELAKRWKMNAGSVRNWRAEGKGPPFVTLGKAGRGKRPRVLYRLADIEAYEQRNRKGGA